jgi:hypothetical protein
MLTVSVNDYPNKSFRFFWFVAISKQNKTQNSSILIVDNNVPYRSEYKFRVPTSDNKQFFKLYRNLSNACFSFS